MREPTRPTPIKPSASVSPSPAMPPAVRAGLVEALARLLVADLEREQAADGGGPTSVPPR